jgi:hypothetical protein
MAVPVQHWVGINLSFAVPVRYGKYRDVCLDIDKPAIRQSGKTVASRLQGKSGTD